MPLQMPGFSLSQECSSHHFLLVNNISRKSCGQSSSTVDSNWISHSLVIISARRSITNRDLLERASSALRKKDTSKWGQGDGFLAYHTFSTRCASELQAEARAPCSIRRCYHDISSPSPPPQYYNSEAVSDSEENGESRERASTPAERAKRRIAVDRGLKIEAAESRQASDILDPAVPTSETETAFSGREEDTTRGSSLNPASSEPIKESRAQRIANRSSGSHPFPSFKTIALILGACGLALAVAMSRQRPPRLLEREAGAVSELIIGTDTSRTQLLGHYRVEEAPVEDLVSVLADGSVHLRSAAATSFLHMQHAARQDGVYLVPLSGYRSVESQKSVFFGIKSERNQPLRERAKVSAPPGYSEHHTGYALDMGDADCSDTHLEYEFEQSGAFQWLQENANRFHFELSFPPGNEQGIMYEPWHWRFVGNDHSALTFYGVQDTK